MPLQLYKPGLMVCYLYIHKQRLNSKEKESIKVKSAHLFSIVSPAGRSRCRQSSRPGVRQLGPQSRIYPCQHDDLKQIIISFIEHSHSKFPLPARIVGFYNSSLLRLYCYYHCLAHSKHYIKISCYCFVLVYISIQRGILTHYTNQ